MYIKQILYLLEKFVTVLGGKEPYVCPTPAAQWAGPGSLGAVRASGFSVSSDCLGNSLRKFLFYRA